MATSSRADRGLDVELGDQTYKITPQRIGRLSRQLDAIFELFSGVAEGNADVEELATDRLHEIFLVFVPDLMPLWKWQGYPNEEAFRAVLERKRTLREAKVAYAAARTPEGAEEPLTWSQLGPEEREDFEDPDPDFTDPYDAALDRSPDPMQLMDAVETIFKAHGGARLVRLLKNFFTPEMIRGAIKRWQIEASLNRSRSLQRQSGELESTSSSPTSPTSTGLSED